MALFCVNHNHILILVVTLCVIICPMIDLSDYPTSVCRLMLHVAGLCTVAVLRYNTFPYAQA